MTLEYSMRLDEWSRRIGAAEVRSYFSSSDEDAVLSYDTCPTAVIDCGRGVGFVPLDVSVSELSDRFEVAVAEDDFERARDVLALIRERASAGGRVLALA